MSPEKLLASSVRSFPLRLLPGTIGFPVSVSRVDRTDRGKGAGRADMHTGSDDQITLNQNFPVHTYASLPP